MQHFSEKNWKKNPENALFYFSEKSSLFRPLISTWRPLKSNEVQAKVVRFRWGSCNCDLELARWVYFRGYLKVRTCFLDRKRYTFLQIWILREKIINFCLRLLFPKWFLQPSSNLRTSSFLNLRVILRVKEEFYEKIVNDKSFLVFSANFKFAIKITCNVNVFSNCFFLHFHGKIVGIGHFCCKSEICGKTEAAVVVYNFISKMLP